jgi:16S rRNA (adenine1518-N6/adenine1519-N6)-dimethyltransferase
MPTHQTLTYLKQRFEQVGLKLNSRHGQNFLIDLNLVRVIVDTARLSSDDVVLEVGTGVGSLTGLIAPQVAHVVTVEIDPRMAQLASEDLIDIANVTVLPVDALAGKHTLNPLVLAEIDRHLSAASERRFKLVANLPYVAATPLIANLLELDRPPETMTVTIQKELGERLAAQPGTKDYGALSFWVQCQCRVEIMRILPPTVFWPRPKVHSAIVQITLEPERRRALADRRYFHDFVRKLFLHRRKFLRGVLVAAFKNQLEKSAIDAVLEEIMLPENARAEELSVDQMIRVSEQFRRKGAKIEFD